MAQRCEKQQASSTLTILQFFASFGLFMGFPHTNKNMKCVLFCFVATRKSLINVLRTKNMENTNKYANVVAFMTITI